MRLCIDTPQQTNSSVMQSMIAAGKPLLAFQKVPQSLEQAYLAAIAKTVGGGK
jgi:hypothetical protein